MSRRSISSSTLAALFYCRMRTVDWRSTLAALRQLAGRIELDAAHLWAMVAMGWMREVVRRLGDCECHGSLQLRWDT